MTGMLRAGIIGAGRIGWRYDGGRWDGKPSVTHASCIDRHARTTLVAMHDPVDDVCQEFSAAFPNVLSTTSLQDFFASKLDLVCIASPSEHHAAHLLACFEAGIRYILQEKPVTLELAEYHKVLQHWRQLQLKPRLHVNFFRRVLPQAAKLREAFNSHPPKGIEIAYSRGLAINGVHLLDLLGFVTKSAPPEIIDWVAGTAVNPSFGFRLGHVPVTVVGYDLPYHCIEFRMLFDHGRLAMVDGGMRLEYEPVEPTPNYSGFFHLGMRTSAFDETEAAQAMEDGTYKGLCLLLDDQAEQVSSLEAAGFAQQLVHMVDAACRRD